ncbi:hypothetical protein C5Y96_12225 [Blastopirellula marina]|uniref:Leucine-rich repeat domain-containing protein n=1 Tax=Blastopirellula marina TaxID=124 RepID=A0A2S8FG38_9BACT|nr:MULTISPECIES: hypothetical protein [Pirellulaceae]PQO31117.1 hypothetical protein C5Y96_12225 [Blastopirellula marina]RCS51511.1 hypothetical protein DTL36_12235 [Bremerella cremea]
MSEVNQDHPKPRRRWLSFGLRGLMVLVLLMSLPMGWIARDIYRAQRESEVVAAVEKAGGYASYDYHENVMWAKPPEPSGPWVLRKLFGEHIHSYVTHVTCVESEEINTLVPRLADCHRLESLSIPAVELSDSSVETIARMPRLKHLALLGTTLSIEKMRTLTQALPLNSITLIGPTATDDYLELLPELPALEEVNLRETTITDRGMKSLGQLPQLKSLEIEQAPEVTNVGFAELSSCQKLTYIYAIGIKVDEGCVDTLKSIPELDDVYITPDDLDIEYYAWGTMRLDTLTPVKITVVMGGFCGTFAALGPEPTGPRIIHVDTQYISVSRYDDDEFEDLPQPKQKVYSPK